ncbi:Isoprenylcysteine carboxyl methyltransferase [Penicillium longicatenatum]|nr:Isoprenylcysteine carboxyl methyltransferase [Penicillium longicatenatum]
MASIIDSITSGSEPTQGDPNISWPMERITHPTPAQEWHLSSLVPGRRDSTPPKNPRTAPQTETPTPSNYPKGSKSLSGISLRAFFIGTSLGITIMTTVLLSIVFPTPLWRVPFFVASLSVFHFLEFYTTATYNTRAADVNAFLLSSNGWAYNVAHGSAIVECIVSHVFWPGQSTLGKLFHAKEPVSGTSIPLLLVVGLLLMAVGQLIRSFAMAQAASNFNHHVQSEHREGHMLVTHGLYRFLRHPSYFGFFWWGLGTQLVLGNVVCFFAYSLVLWKFFSTRIKREERFLIQFFGAEYVHYRQSTPVGIPLIR